MSAKQGAFDGFIGRLPSLAREFGLALRVNSASTETGGHAEIFALEEGVMYKERIDSFENEFLNSVEDRLTDDKSKPKRFNFAITPELRAQFDALATEQHLPLTELMRRAVFAAIYDPSILRTPEVEDAEAAYKASLGPSRWS